MLHQIKTFKGNALALELTGTFTQEDEKLCEQLFTEKINEGHEHVNLLFKVKDMTQFKDMDIKAFFSGESWGIKNFGKIGRCAVVAHSNFIRTAVNIESKVLHRISNALEEKYFDEEQLDEALKFVSPDE
ncbi:STAS/SEC14 domain-containing protein [Fluviicola sp.]|jgi:acetylglutamate synthase|uniref:STAS/SEC14 domain-containing protein n=1 Tax=Fluviicola sp. TaxID=1917219 RepID=UPI0028207AA4|nr:STAS/SEC14 domain-containing protein [Fluviicola sp.]MDR0800938.1 STAS/SEC14 domain-containing protein [Fluviicola sp.]